MAFRFQPSQQSYRNTKPKAAKPHDVKANPKHILHPSDKPTAKIAKSLMPRAFRNECSRLPSCFLPCDWFQSEIPPTTDKPTNRLQLEGKSSHGKRRQPANINQAVFAPKRRTVSFNSLHRSFCLLCFDIFCFFCTALGLGRSTLF